MPIRSALPRRAARAGLAAGLLAMTLSTGGAALASSHHALTRNFTPIEECASWTGTVTGFPALTSKPHQVTAVLQATLANCAFYGVAQSGTATAFGVLTGTASRGKATLSGQVAVTWPPELGTTPTIANIVVVPSAHAYAFDGPVVAGVFPGRYLVGNYQVTSSTRTGGGTAQSGGGREARGRERQSILGTAPFAVWEPVG
jgi:hypothetical protein